MNLDPLYCVKVTPNLLRELCDLLLKRAPGLATTADIGTPELIRREHARRTRESLDLTSALLETLRRHQDPAIDLDLLIALEPLRKLLVGK